MTDDANNKDQTSIKSLMGHPPGFSGYGDSKLLDFGVRRHEPSSPYSKVVNLSNQALVQELMSDTEFFDKFQLEQMQDNEECFKITARQFDEKGVNDIAVLSGIVKLFGQPDVLSTAEQNSIQKSIEECPRVAEDKQAFLKSFKP